MAHDQTTELFMPPNMLKAKVGGGLGGIDMAALKRADAALETLSAEYADFGEFYIALQLPLDELFRRLQL